jgi:hypothetical protein
MIRAHGSRLRDLNPSAPNPEPKEFLGGYAEGVTPVPIPNTEVKPLRVDGTARVAVWESRSPPGILLMQPLFLSETRAALRFNHKTIADGDS